MRASLVLQFGITPLIHSAARGYADAVEMLLRAGAKPGLMDMEGKNALDYAESAEFDDVVTMLSACDDGPSICSTSRDGATEAGLLSQRGTMSQRGIMGAAGAAQAPPMSQRGGGATPRMTPRVPLAGEVSSRLTPRAPSGGTHGSGGASGRNSQRATPSAYRGGNGRTYDINQSQIGSLPTEKMVYLAKKLVHLSILLEQDTVTEDFKYPSFHSPNPSPNPYSNQHL